MRFSLLLFVALLLVGTFGCRRTRDFSSPFPNRELRDGRHRVTTAEELTATLAERGLPIDRLWGRAVVVLRDEERRRSNLFSVLAVYEEPDQIRLRGSRNPIGTLFEIVLSGEFASISFNRDGIRFDGTTEELAERTAAIGNLSPRDFLDALLVQQRLAERIRSGQPVAVRKAGNDFLVATRSDRTGRIAIYLIRGRDGLITEYQLREPDGTIALQVRYGGFSFQQRRNEQLIMPSRFNLFLPQDRFRLTSREIEYRFDERFDPRTFQPPPMRQIFPLSSLEFEELP